MAYIGRGVDNISNVEKLDNISFSGSTATFNLTKGGTAFIPSSAECIRLAIDGVEQGNNYTVSGSQITFDFTPSGSSTNNWIYHIGVGVITTPADGSVTEAKIGSSAVTTAKINDGAVTSGKIASGVIPSTRPNANPLIINGDMAVAQRSTSASSISSAGYHALDRFRYSNSSSAVVVTISQETLSSGNAYLNGFHNAMKLDCTTADTSVASGHLTAMQYKLEAQDCTVFRKGTANAQKMTVAFWFKATKTGTYILQLGDSDNNRKISKSYTVSTTNTWEHKVLVFDIETSNPMNDDNGAGFVLTWWLVAGSDYSGGTLATSWEANEFNSNSAVGQVNAFDSTSNNVHITGIQAEVGEFTSTTLPPFQHESFGNNLARCQRYAYQVVSNESTAGNSPIGVGGAQYNSGQMQFSIPFPVPMRTNPSLTCSSASNNYSFIRNDAADNFDDFVIDKANSNLAECKNGTDMSGTPGQAGVVRTANSGLSVLFSAEL